MKCERCLDNPESVNVRTVGGREVRVCDCCAAIMDSPTYDATEWDDDE